MKFDISALDKAKVLQALFRHAFVRGYGVIADKANEGKNELDYNEALNIIYDNTETLGEMEVVSVDYIHGRPIKLSYKVDRGVVDSHRYDVRHGKYRFLLALITEFGSNSVIVVRKGYPREMEKPKEIDIDEMTKEYKAYSMDVHFLDMKKKFNLN